VTSDVEYMGDEIILSHQNSSKHKQRLVTRISIVEQKN